MPAGRQSHQQDEEDENPFSAGTVSNMCHNNATNRAHRITGSQNTKCQCGCNPVIHIRRKKQVADDPDKNTKIIKSGRSAK